MTAEKIVKIVKIVSISTATQKLSYGDDRICRALKNAVHLPTNTIVNEFKTKGQCTEDVQLSSLVVQHFNGCTAL